MTLSDTRHWNGTRRASARRDRVTASSARGPRQKKPARCCAGELCVRCHCRGMGRRRNLHTRALCRQSGL